MRFMSFLRFFGKRWLRGKPIRSRGTAPRSRGQLLFEALERREAPAVDVPRIVSVMPVDHSTVSTQTPAIRPVNCLLYGPMR